MPTVRQRIRTSRPRRRRSDPQCRRTKSEELVGLTRAETRGGRDLSDGSPRLTIAFRPDISIVVGH